MYPYNVNNFDPKLCILALLLSGCSSITTNIPGFRTALTSKGFDYICLVVVPILEKELSSLSIPDISGSADTPIGAIDYKLTKIKLSDLKIPTSLLTSNTEGLVIQASDLSLHVYSDWQYRENSWPHIEDHGNCDIDASKVSLEIDIAVAADSTGHAMLSTTYCHLYIDKLDIDFHGGASWLYNLFSSYISDDLKHSIEDQVCSVAKNEIEKDGNKALASIPVNVPIDSIAEIDFALIEDPIFTSTYMETKHKGEFLDLNHPVDAPFTPPSLPAVSGNSSMLYMWLTDYMADTAGFVYQTAGLLHYTITPSMVPPSLTFQLNTSYFKDILPQLYTKFPNWDMELELNATKPPLLTLTPSGGNFTVFGDVLVNVLQLGNSSDKQLAFILGSTVYADTTFYLSSDNKRICANTKFLKIDLSLVSSSIGYFSVEVLQVAANLLSTLFIIPSINHYANSGVTLPTMDGLSLVNAALSFGNDYVVVATDILYT